MKGERVHQVHHYILNTQNEWSIRLGCSACLGRQQLIFISIGLRTFMRALRSKCAGHSLSSFLGVRMLGITLAARHGLSVIRDARLVIPWMVHLLDPFLPFNQRKFPQDMRQVARVLVIGPVDYALL